MPVKVLLDANFVLLSLLFPGDVFEEMDKSIGRRAEKIVLMPVYQELKRLSWEGPNAVRKQADAALKRVDADDIALVDVEMKTSETVDDLIVRVAASWKCFVATNDRTLRNRLIHAGVPVVYQRQRNQIEVRGAVNSK